MLIKNEPFAEFLELEDDKRGLLRVIHLGTCWIYNRGRVAP